MIARASLAACVAVALACAPRPAVPERSGAPEAVVVPTELPNGRIELALQPRYTLGSVTRVDVAIVVTRGTISGPTEARVLASGIGGDGRPSEVLVKRIATSPVAATVGRRATTTVLWDGTDEFGARVPADAYVLLLEFASDDGTGARTVRAATTLQMND